MRRIISHFQYCSIIFVCLALNFLPSCSGPRDDKTLEVFSGSAVKPAMDEIIRLYEEETGTTVGVQYGGSGTVLSKMELGKRGDVYISGSPDFMEKAKRKGLVKDGTEEILAYLIPAIIVQKNNPKNIESIEDLAKPGMSVGIANPESVCVGTYAIEILEKNRLTGKVLKNVKVHPESCSKTASIIAMKKVDAVFGWRVFSKWNENNEAVMLKPEEISRIAYIPAAVSIYSKKPDTAGLFIKFLKSEKSRSALQKHGYITSRAEAVAFAPGAAIGGEYKLPDLSGFN